MKMHYYSAFRDAQVIEAGSAAPESESTSYDYQYKETRDLVQLVKEAADLINMKGEAAFSDFIIPDSQWRKADTYIFVLDPEGNMIVHPDPELEGKSQLSLQDVNGKYIIRGLIEAATEFSDKPEGWYHYQWRVPGGLLPRWKSSYVRLVKTGSGKSFIVGAGMYNDRMERVFVLDMVKHAVAEIEKRGEAAFALFRDPAGPFAAKDAYIFVTDMNAVELVNPAFPNLEGRQLLDLKDTNGKLLNREMLNIVQTRGAGWVDYMWPRPGESLSTQKSAYVSAAKLGNQQVMVGCGVYLADAPQETRYTPGMSANELMKLVRDAATLLETEGEKAFAAFRIKGSKWFRYDTYIFAATLDGTRVFHAAEPETEGRNYISQKDILGKPIVKMIVDAGNTIEGEGWVHYMYPEPGNIFPAWKSTFVKKVKLPSGKELVAGSGIYNMQMDRKFIEDVVNRAADLIIAKGKKAFPELRDKTGPFIFMDTYIFVETPDGIELVNGAQPSLEGENILNVRDVFGKAVVRDEIKAALTNGTAWVEGHWYRPGTNTPALKHTYVRKVEAEGVTYIVGSGIYEGEEPNGSMKKSEIQKISWESIGKEQLTANLSRQMVSGEKATISRLFAKSGTTITRHSHNNEEYCWMISGSLKYNFDDREVVLKAGETLVVPSNVSHAIVVLEDALFIDFFAPRREDWLRGEDQYLRK